MSKEYAAFERALQQHGYRLTRPRRAVVEALLASGGHVSADELVVVVHEYAPNVGRMTVYRTLELLAELGLIRPVYLGSGAAHYVLLEGGHHHHLVCTGCARVIEFDDCGLKEMEQLVAERFQFMVQGHLLEFYGRCQSCQQSVK
jgi:Fur family ferric uptake transcriptional regulator